MDRVLAGLPRPDWAADWLALVPVASAPKYADAAARYLKWCHRHRIDPLRATPRHIAAYRGILLEGEQGQAPLGAGTVRHHITALRHMYRSLTEELALVPGIDPARHVQLPRYDPPGQPRTTDMQRRLALDAARQWRGPMATRNRAIVFLVAYCIPRVAEIVHMPLKTYTNPPQGGAWLDWSTKRAGHRATRVPAEAAAITSRWVAERRNLVRELKALGITPADNLFISRNGRPLSRSYVFDVVTEASRSAGIDPPLPPHSYRRGAVREGRRHGSEKGDLQTWGGWRKAEMVDRYGGEQAVPLERDPGIAMYRRDQEAAALAAARPGDGFGWPEGGAP